MSNKPESFKHQSWKITKFSTTKINLPTPIICKYCIEEGQVRKSRSYKTAWAYGHHLFHAHKDNRCLPEELRKLQDIIEKSERGGFHG